MKDPNKRVLIVDCLDNIGQKVQLAGWVSAVRDHGKITFFDLVDRSGVIQIVFVGSGDKVKLANQDVIRIDGVVGKRPDKLVNPKLKTGTIEVNADKIILLSKAHELPFDMGDINLELTLPTLLDFRSLTLRHPRQKAIQKVYATVIDTFRKSLIKRGFYEFQAPTIIPEIPEGGAEVFEVKYFDHKAYLAQSPQLYKQILVAVFERVFSVNKIFRAEPSVTTRHLTEVVSLDAEFGFIDSWLDVVEMAEYVVREIISAVDCECAEELDLLQAKVPQISQKIPILKLREAQEIIFKRTKTDHRREKDLSPDDEREICAWAQEEAGSELVFVSHYPTKTRPFYTYPDPDNPEYNQGFDLMGRGIEWLTGGRRIEDYDLLVKHAKEWKVDLAKIDLYLQAFKYGMPPEGGFAFGAERITQGILGLKNIREAALFPRDMERVDVRLSAKPEE